MNWMRTTLLFLLLASFLLAGTTGKIAGTVTDAATGEPLIGVNLVVQGTGMGATTNLDGYFVILNVPPGFHTLAATMIGYSRYEVTDVRVEIDRTTEVDVVMAEEILEGQTVVITAERKVIQMDVAASQRSMTAENIEALPVNSVEDVLGLQAGVSGFSIRGGSSDETMFMVDGVLLKDQRTNRPITGIPLSAVQEISVQTGGFSAEYHDVRSGVVNVVTKEGDPERYGGSISIKVSPPAAKHFGISPYDPDFFFLRPYLDDAVAWTGTKVGEPYTDLDGNGWYDEGEPYVDYNGDGDRTYWDSYTQRQYAEFQGWNALSQENLGNAETDDDLSPAAAQKIFSWQYRKDGRIVAPDLNLDLGFGGPVPFVSESLGNLRFFASYREDQQQYLYSVSRDGLTERTGMLKLTSDLRDNMKLTFTGIRGNVLATTISRGGGTDYVDSIWDLAGAANQAGFTVPWRLYSNDYWAPTTVNHTSFSAKFTHILSSATYYEVMVKRLAKQYDTHPGGVRDTAAVYEVFDGFYADEAPFGFWGKPVNSVEGELTMGGAVSTSRDESQISTTTIKADFTSQLDRRNQAKAGIELVFDDLDLQFGSINYFLPEGNYWTTVDRSPFRATAYVQDKLEFEGFISTVGLNLDIIAPGGEWYDIDVFNEAFFGTGYDSQSDLEVPMKKIDPQVYLSPRLSISHPISITSKLYFNYGHYRQIPTSEALFRIQREATLDNNGEIESLTQLSLLGDPTLPQARTISYELGYDQVLADKYLLHLSAYYKDISNQPNWVDYISANGAVNYSQLDSRNYEDIRGFEADISKTVGEWMTGMLNYEYRVNTSGYFDLRAYYENPSEQRNYELTNEKQSKPRPQPRVKSTVDLHTPLRFGPRLANQYPLGDWHLTLLGNWTAGSYFTYPSGLSAIEYNFQWKDSKNVDLKLSKSFRLGNASLKFFADVNNVFNIKNISGYGFEDVHDYDYYMQSLLISAADREKIGLPVFPGLDGDDRPGEIRPDDVEFVPLEWRSDINQNPTPQERPIYYDAASGLYLSFDHSDLDGAAQAITIGDETYTIPDGYSEVTQGRLDQVIADKAYIDNPNLGSFIYLNPRDIFIGLSVSYDF